MLRALVRFNRYWLALIILFFLATTRMLRELWICLRIVSWWATSAPLEMEFHEAYLIGLTQRLQEMEEQIENSK